MLRARPIRSVFIAVTLVGTLLAIVVPSASGAPGDLDPTFNPGGGLPGTVTTSIGESQDGTDVAVQDDRKVVVVGMSDGDLAVVRYKANGDLDPTFGGDGIVTTDIGESWDAAHGVAIQPDDGKIVVVGESDGDFVVARYEMNGDLDPTFGGGGVVTTDFFESTDVAYDVAVGGDGKIVVVGVAGGYVDEAAFARYEPDGDPDPTFDGDGRVGMDVFDDGGSDVLRGVALHDGGIVAVGDTWGGYGGVERARVYAPAPFDQDALIMRLDDTGAPDLAFGEGGGAASLDLLGYERFEDVAAAGSRLIAVGTDGYAFLVTRWRSGGTLSDGFGSGGIVLTDFGQPSDATGVAQMSGGGIAVGGTTSPDYGEGAAGALAVTSDDFALAKYLDDGGLDLGFGGGDGLVTTDVSGGDDRAKGLALSPHDDGVEKIVLGGTADPGVAAARYLGSVPAPGPSASPPPDGGGTVGPDLQILKTDLPDPVSSTDDVLYTLEVTNLGVGGSSAVTVSDELSNEATFLSATPSQGSCAYDADLHRVRCDLGPMAEDDVATVDIVVSSPFVSVPTEMNDRATVTSANDPNPTNNVALETTTVMPKSEQDSAIGYIPPEGGSITTDQGGGATKGDPVVLTMWLGPQTGAQTAAPANGGIAQLIERRCGKRNILAPCIAKTLGDYRPPAGFTNVRAVFTFDRSVTKGRTARSIVVTFQKASGDPVLVLDRCGDPRVAPCVFKVRRLRATGDLKVRVFLGTDPKMSVR